ncbi:MAG: ribosome biogenesis GTPase Der [Acidobacteria bacterium]|nr:ribosome biogenesis GTPase Der [Acidobacteriota bacterium]TDI49083.1 MAG: ribosome biogenesis GTPase Der [Acidobacteriota bacterium]TDI54180.1 MAG: ribosome biogenesis GTPase Der [Acidobacteriota bacterium]
MSVKPVVAVVGRPNVGKSTLVNRIIGSRSAVVEKRPGVTRDRREYEADWAGRDFILVDTGGWEVKPDGDLNRSIREQAEGAVSGADAVILVVDGTTELTNDDTGVISILRSADIPILLAANKIDDETAEWNIDRFWGLGLGDPQAISAYHGRGVGDLLDELVAVLPDSGGLGEEDQLPRIAIVGRPNVGKSTLLNHLLGEERVIVSAVPGTTRDPIDVDVEINGETYRIVDTAGIRRKPQITEDVDFYAVLRAREALEEADVALLMIDSGEGVTHQDQRIASEIVAAGAGILILLNKWDVLDEEQRELTESSLPDRFGFISWAPALRMSALTGARVGRLGAAIEAVFETRVRRIPTGPLNRDIRDWTQAHPPPVRKGRRPKIHYVVQAGVSPPTFVIFISGGDLGEDYLRFLENRLRDKYDFVGNPIHFVTRNRAKR